MLPVNKLGWMAGIIDLKGNVCYKNNKKRRTQQIVLMVETKEMVVIRELSSLTGTSPELKAPQTMPEWMRKGCTEHCPESHIHVTRYPQHMPATARWTISGVAASVVLFNLMPFLMSDRGFHEAMMEGIKNAQLHGQGSGATLAALHRLRELGWIIPEELPITISIETEKDEQND